MSEEKIEERMIEIDKNYKIHKKIIKKYISEERQEKIFNMISDLEDEYIVAPASSKKTYHNCFPGGYLDHVNRVVLLALNQKEMYQEMGGEVDFTEEELVMAALFHDLGKIGDKNVPTYIPQTDSWRRDKLQETYSANPELQFMLIQDRSLYTLQKYGIQLSEKEYLGIKLHDGLYDDTNKPYYISFNPDSKLKSNLTYILHTADFLASKIEFDKHKNL